MNKVKLRLTIYNLETHNTNPQELRRLRVIDRVLRDIEAECKRQMLSTDKAEANEAMRILAENINDSKADVCAYVRGLMTEGQGAA